MVRLFLMTCLFALAATVPALAQGEAWQDRITWDWGQHQTGFGAEVQEMPVVPTQMQDHWDYPGAPVRFAEHGRRG